MRVAIATVLSFLTGALFWAAQPAIRERLAPAPEPTGLVAPDAVDATPYRDAIAAIEAVLYREASPDWGDPERVAAAAKALGEQLYERLGPPRGARALVEFVDFANAAAAQADGGFAAPELDAPRAAWESLRARWFVPAHWFAHTTARLVAAQRPPAPTASLVELHEHWKWAAAIESLVEAERTAFAGQAAAGSTSSPSATAPASAPSFDDRVRELAARAPRAPLAGGEPNLVFAHEALEQAVRQLARASGGGDATASGDADSLAQSLEAAAMHVDAARRFLARAHTGAAVPQTAALP